MGTLCKLAIAALFVGYGVGLFAIRLYYVGRRLVALWGWMSVFQLNDCVVRVCEVVVRYISREKKYIP